MVHLAKSDIAGRAEVAVCAVLPRSVKVVRVARNNSSVDLAISGVRVEVKWLGEGGLRQVRELLTAPRHRPQVVVARRMSPGAREALSAAGVGWVDETGAAEIALGSVIVSRSGRPAEPRSRPPRWTPSVLAVAETILCGGKATVGAMQDTTGLSAGSCTNALRALTDLGLLTSAVRRGRGSARQIPDRDRLLDEYATAVAAMAPATTLGVGVTWRDFIASLSETGRRWEKAGVAWAATGAIAASVTAPYLTSVTSAEVFVDAKTIAGLESVAAEAGLRPIAGGRLILRPFPTVTARLLAAVRDGLRVAPWPRVYADLRVAGVRGEEAAEHLREVARGR